MRDFEEKMEAVLLNLFKGLRGSVVEVQERKDLEISHLLRASL